MMASQPPPALNIPASTVVVKVHIIDTTLRLNGIYADAIWNPPIKGFDRFKAGTWAFLIEHPSGRKLLYDLGLRKDWESLPPRVGLQEAVMMGVIADITVEKNVAQILVEAGVKLEEVEGIIWRLVYICPIRESAHMSIATFTGIIPAILPLSHQRQH
jgi:hypothetical protein